MKIDSFLSGYFPDLKNNANLPLPLRYTQLYTLYTLDKQGNFILYDNISPKAKIAIYDNLDCDLNVAPNKPISKIIS